MNKRKNIKGYPIVFVVSVLSYLMWRLIDKDLNRFWFFYALLLLFIICFAIFNAIIVKREYNSIYNSDLKKIDHMDGKTFEKYMKVYFEKKGYKVELTPKSNDYGADLILVNNKEKIVVQVKRYKNKIGIGAIQEIVAAKNYYNANKMLVVTNSYFTSQARTLAKANKVLLWDRNNLMKHLNH